MEKDMKKYLKKLPKEIRDFISVVSDLALSCGMRVYLVGGFVRDLILRVNNLDLDIVVEGDGIKFAEFLSKKLNAGLTLHRRFGTATLIIDKYFKVDIATARKEYYPEPAHLPVVTSGTLKDDLIRRDFTINAMAISINRRDFGVFIDCFGSKKDLAAKKIRVLHDLSFIDDPTRILRAIRFEQRFDFSIEPKTLKLLREAKRLKMLEKVQPHRLRDELTLLLKENKPLKQLSRIKELIGFDFISPGLKLSKKLSLFLKSIESEMLWFKEKYPRRRKLDAWLMYLMGLISELDADSIRLTCRRFAFRRGEEIRMLSYEKIRPDFLKKLNCDKIKPSEVFGMLEPLSYEVIILIKARLRSKTGARHINDFFGIYNGMRIHISGEDLRKLGLAPGPDYQKIFHRVLNAKLDGLVKTKAEELALIKKWS